MHKRNGFTAVELTIAMVVMAILLTIGVISFRSSMAHARDRERQADVEAIAVYLEGLYGQEVKNSSGQVIKKAGAYPYLDCGIADGSYYADCMLGSPYTINTSTLTLIKDAGATVIRSPLETGEMSLVTPASQYDIYDRSNVLVHTVPSATQLGVDKYFYRPQDSDTNACRIGPSNSNWQQGCRSFTLYYVLEGSPNVLQKVESRRK